MTAHMFYVFGNCFICNDDEYLIETDCLIQLNPDKDSTDNRCPICRKHIYFTD